MDWSDFQTLYFFFKNSKVVLYLGEIDLLNFTLLNAEKVFFISPARVDIANPKLRKFQENPEYFDLKNLPKSVDSIINLLPFNIITSFKIMDRFLGLLSKGQKFLVRVKILDKQARYSNLIINDLLPKFNVEKIAHLEIEEQEYIVGRKL